MNMKIAAVVNLFENDHRITSRMKAESWFIPKTVVLRVLKEGLRKRKFFALCVLHSLTPEQKENPVTYCRDIIAMSDADKIFF